jgi:hypothetical protein
MIIQSGDLIIRSLLDERTGKNLKIIYLRSHPI